MKIKRLADKLAEHHGTRDPFRIASSIGYIIVETPLKEIRGFYQYINKCHIIYIDNALTHQEKQWVCAHELGHSILHKGLNRIFMDTHTHMVTGRYEKEADKFAVNLLFSDDEMQHLKYYSIPTVANCLGINNDLAEYRLKNVCIDY